MSEPIPKSECFKCHKLPEGIVVKGHDHRPMTNPEQKIKKLWNGDYIKFVDGKPVNCIDDEATHIFYRNPKDAEDLVKFERFFRSDEQRIKYEVLSSLLERGPFIPDPTMFQEDELKFCEMVGRKRTDEEWRNLINLMIEE